MHGPHLLSSLVYTNSAHCVFRTALAPGDHALTVVVGQQRPRRDVTYTLSVFAESLVRCACRQ